MENLSLGLTNEDLVEIDEFIVHKHNDKVKKPEWVSLINKNELLSYADTWTKVDMKESNFRNVGPIGVYKIELPYEFKNRIFDLCVRTKEQDAIFQYTTTHRSDSSADIEVNIIVGFKAKASFSDIVDIWFRLIIPPTGQYSIIDRQIKK